MSLLEVMLEVAVQNAKYQSYALDFVLIFELQKTKTPSLDEN